MIRSAPAESSQVRLTTGYGLRVQTGTHALPVRGKSPTLSEGLIGRRERAPPGAPDVFASDEINVSNREVAGLG